MNTRVDVIRRCFLPTSMRSVLFARFLSYVQMDTQSDEDEKNDGVTLPKQIAFGDMLAKELVRIGCTEVVHHQCGYVFATIPASDGCDAVPTVGFMAHMDTYHGTPGANVKPQVIENYNGEPINLSGTPGKRISDPALKECVGHTIITSDGTTLLGADDKAGIAEIMTFADSLLTNPEIKHGKIRICLTTNEEVGRGTEHFENPELNLLQLFGAQYAHTIDGGELGEVEDETFSADTATVTITGRECHPGVAKKGGMINAVRAAAALVDGLDLRFIPETTENRQSFLHPNTISGDTTKVVVSILVRAFTLDELHEREESLRGLINAVSNEFPGIVINLKITESYRNMKQILDQHPQVMKNAVEALRRQDITPRRIPVRGGTDGCEMSKMGVPTINLFAGGHNMHALDEWVSLDVMVKAVETMVQLAIVWAE